MQFDIVALSQLLIIVSWMLLNLILQHLINLKSFQSEAF